MCTYILIIVYVYLLIILYVYIYFKSTFISTYNVVMLILQLQIPFFNKLSTAKLFHFNYMKINKQLIFDQID